ncbi:GreA/GreB family elongation factor [Nocardia flavorosea]|uniref:Transcription elongation factor GreAB n=1 Tax=Nocardia flavorosea TaxID=53429 RepID=A0A846YAF1_9NOCA|nr:GreA/GreB family elongation factor [Nocardia flavorosea]NKY54780.1 transcription elongation factor GreAB [Nocardia flavorosea]
MTSSSPIWLTTHAREQLEDELAELLAIENAGHTEAADTQDQFAARHQRQNRIAHIRNLLSNAVFGEDPPDDGIAEPGMVLTIRYDGTDDTETFLLGSRDAEHSELEVYSPDSPLGAALTGARRGDQRSYKVPNGTEIAVTLLDAVPYSHTVTAAPRPAR